MSEHRVPLRGPSWRRVEDPALSHDPRVREVVAALRTLPAPAVRPEFRAELRAQLVAITPRFVSESTDQRDSAIAVAARPKPKPDRAGARRAARHAPETRAHVRLGRPLAILACVITTFALLLGGAVWMSRGSLPGDTLYGLKRAGERVELATAGSDMDKARDYLDFARTRVSEARDLLKRADAAGALAQADAVSPGTTRLITSTLESADHDLRAAASLIGREAVRSRSATPLATMTSWAPGQLSRLRAITLAMPTPALQAKAQSSTDLVIAALNRAHDLAKDLGCSCLSLAHADALGPLPCGPCTRARTPDTPNTPGRTGGARQPAPHSSSAPPSTRPAAHNSRSPGGSGHLVVTPPPTSAQASTTPTAGSSASASGSSSTPTGRAPLVPTPSVSASSCGLGATLGPLGINLGLCPLGLQLHLGN